MRGLGAEKTKRMVAARFKLGENIKHIEKTLDYYVSDEYVEFIVKLSDGNVRVYDVYDNGIVKAR